MVYFVMHEFMAKVYCGDRVSDTAIIHPVDHVCSKKTDEFHIQLTLNWCLGIFRFYFKVISFTKMKMKPQSLCMWSKYCGLPAWCHMLLENLKWAILSVLCTNLILHIFNITFSEAAIWEFWHNWNVELPYIDCYFQNLWPLVYQLWRYQFQGNYYPIWFYICLLEWNLTCIMMMPLPLLLLRLFNRPVANIGAINYSLKLWTFQHSCCRVKMKGQKLHWDQRSPQGVTVKGDIQQSQNFRLAWLGTVDRNKQSSKGITSGDQPPFFSL